MLADGCEARVRAVRPKDTDEMRALIKSVIDDRIALGQLTDTDLTLRDLDTITDSFTTTLRGIYHPRIEYPILEKTTIPATEAVPTLPTSARLQQEPASPSESEPSPLANNTQPSSEPEGEPDESPTPASESTP